MHRSCSLLNMSKFLVTGATGYVGKHLVKQLIKNKHEVVVFSRKPRMQVAEFFPSDNLEIVNFDFSIPNFHKLRNLNLGNSILVDLAWDFASQNHRKQVDQHMRFVCELVKIGVAKVAVAGTLQEFELNQGQVQEDSPRLGEGSHGKAKAELFFRLSQFLADECVPLLWMRLHYIFGDDLGSRSIFGKILENPEPFLLSPRRGKFDFIQVTTLAEQMSLVLMGESSGTIDFGSGQPQTFREILTKWLSENSKDPDRYLAELEVGSKDTAIGTWPNLKRLAAELGNASCAPLN